MSIAMHGGRGPRGPQGERGATVRTVSAFDWIVVLLLVVSLTIAFTAVYVTLYTRASVEDLEHVLAHVTQEARERRDGTCTLFERQELAAINQVVETYRFLDDASRADFRTPLVRAIVRQLPATYANAKAAAAPGYCRAPGIGLPGAPPRLPAYRTYPAGGG